MPITYTTDSDTHDPNRILPMDYEWAREYYEAGVANNWTPEEIPMGADVRQYEDGTLSEAEQQLVEWNLGFGVDLVDQIRTETDAWTEDFGAEVIDLVERAVELEQVYAREACPDEILGMGPEQFAEYVEFVADRRLAQLDLPEQYGTDNPFPWMSEAADLDREKNFFETQVTEYQSGGQLEW